MKFDVTNKKTGEVRTIEWSNPQEMKAAYISLSEEIKTLEWAKQRVSEAMDRFLGDQEMYDFGDGYELKRISRASKRYPKEVVGEYLDADQLDLVTEVSGTKLKSLIKQLAEENQLQPGTWKAIESRAEITMSKPYVKLQKVL